jgi:UDPglucose--hexose-1-phosphate uridylyltransferase
MSAWLQRLTEPALGKVCSNPAPPVRYSGQWRAAIAEMTNNKLFEQAHRRFNPLTREWVLVSPQRTERPWQGKQERRPEPPHASYDPDCYLCPGNARAGGVRNPKYSSIFVFDNDFAALRPDTSTDELNDAGLLVARAETGICRVVCFSERHDHTLAVMARDEHRKVVDTWAKQYRDLGSVPSINHVQIFENRGAIMGASNPHPHCQIWANANLPNQVEKERRSQLEYLEQRASCLLCDYLELELRQEIRIVCRNNDFVALTPFWAIWPFEVMVLSARHLGDMDGLTQAELDSLADIVHRLCVRYDNLFEVPFPYTMGFHQNPTDREPHPEWHFHAHYYPPLLRSATIPKFMVGYEMLGTPQRDIAPETAAERLRSCSEVHYSRRG